VRFLQAMAEVSKNSGREILQVEGVCKNFGALAALSDVSFRLSQGECLGIIGPNGSGKSTLFNVLCGILQADRGSVVLEGRRIERLPTYRICRLGLMKTAQVVQPFPEMTVLENILIGGLYGRNLSLTQARRQAEEILSWTGLEPVGSQPAEAVTLALRRRLELARALATGPKVLLLDENLAGLLPAEVEEVLILLREINRRGITLVVVEHIMQAVLGLCGRIMVLDSGRKLTEGTPEAVMRDPQVIESFLGSDYV
jgi:branched-chain amino acid transport system ATP-binding protein